MERCAFGRFRGRGRHAKKLHEQLGHVVRVGISQREHFDLRLLWRALIHAFDDLFDQPM